MSTIAPAGLRAILTILKVDFGVLRDKIMAQC
jgi:hypothetical protein